jgi:hypothetical protein
MTLHCLLLALGLAAIGVGVWLLVWSCPPYDRNRSDWSGDEEDR